MSSDQRDNCLIVSSVIIGHFGARKKKKQKHITSFGEIRKKTDVILVTYNYNKPTNDVMYIYGLLFKSVVII